MFRCWAFNFFVFYAIQTFDVLKRRRLKFMSGWNILKIISLGGSCPWVAATLGLEYLSKKWTPYLITAFSLLTLSSDKTQIVGLGDLILWEAATPVFLWLGIPVQNINFLFDDLTNNAHSIKSSSVAVWEHFKQAPNGSTSLRKSLLCIVY